MLISSDQWMSSRMSVSGCSEARDSDGPRRREPETAIARSREAARVHFGEQSGQLCAPDWTQCPQETRLDRAVGSAAQMIGGEDAERHRFP